MRRILILIVAAAAFSTLFAREPATAPQMVLRQTSHDFGDIPRKGGDVACAFEFVNEGTAPLVIKRIVTSCTCTKADYPKKPVAPGEGGVIRITYEPHKKESGMFHKVIQIYTNASVGRNIVTIRGNSLEK